MCLYVSARFTHTFAMSVVMETWNPARYCIKILLAQLGQARERRLLSMMATLYYKCAGILEDLLVKARKICAYDGSASAR